MTYVYAIDRLRAELDTAFPEGSIRAEHTTTQHYYRDVRSGVLAPSVTTIQQILSKPYLRQWAVNQTIEYIRIHHERYTDGEHLEVLAEAKNAHHNTRDQAAEWGTKAHGAFEDYLNEWIKEGVRPQKSAAVYLKEGADAEEIAACRSFDKFLDENEIVPIASEKQVFYNKGGVLFAGTVDSVIIVREVYKDRVGDKTCQHDYAPQDKKLWCVKCNREVREKLVLGDWKTSNHLNGKNEYATQTTAYSKSIEYAVKWKFKEIWVVRFDKKFAHYDIVKVADRERAWELFKANARHYNILSKQEDTLLEPLKVKNIIKL